MKKNNFKGIVFFVCIFIYVLMYKLSTYFTFIGMNYVNLIVKNGLCLGILAYLVKRNYYRRKILPINVLAYFVIMLFLIFIEFLMGISVAFSAPLQGLLILAIVIKYGDSTFLKYFYRSLLIVSIITTIPLIYYYVLWGVYAREVIIFEKNFQTFLFGFSLTILFQELFGNSKFKGLILGLLAYLLFINVFVLQSKTSIFTFLVAFSLMFFFNKRNIIKFFKTKIILIICFAVVLPFLPIKWEIPDSLKQATNYLLNEQVFVLDKNMKDVTYTLRADVRRITWDVVNEHPIVGAGFGNYGKALHSVGLPEGECQYIDFLLDGGYTYLIAFFILTIPCLVKSIKRLLRCTQTPALYADSFIFYQMITFYILCGGNDMLSSLTWIFVASLLYLGLTKEQITIFPKN